jgi:amino acid efflux transporter
MIGRVFGPTMETLSKYLVFFSVPAGSVPAAYIFAEHVSAAFRLPPEYVPVLATGAWVLVAGANYLGLRISAKAQLLLSGLLVALLTFVVIAAFPLVHHDQFVPFAPKGITGIGNAALLIFWSFMGWEAIAHLAEEFHDPKRDMIRAAKVAAVIVCVFYIAITFVLIGSGIFYLDAGKNAPLVDMAEKIMGPGARIFTGVLAAVICLGTMNAYMAGLSRLGYSMARDGNLPVQLGKLDPQSGTPRNSVLFLFCLNCLGIAAQLYFNLSLASFFRLQNVAFLLFYFFGCISIARLLKEQRLALFAAYFSALVCAVMIPFAHGAVLYPAVICSVALISIFAKRKSNPL